MAILRRRVLEAIDLGQVEMGPGMGDTARFLSAHTFGVGLTRDLFAVGEDGACARTGSWKHGCPTFFSRVENSGRRQLGDW